MMVINSFLWPSILSFWRIKWENVWIDCHCFWFAFGIYWSFLFLLLLFRSNFCVFFFFHLFCIIPKWNLSYDHSLEFYWGNVDDCVTFFGGFLRGITLDFEKINKFISTIVILTKIVKISIDLVFFCL